MNEEGTGKRAGTRRSAVVLWLVVAVWFVLPAPLRAETSDEARAGARAAATAGAKAYTERRWVDTIDLMSRAEKLVHSPTHLLYMAKAYLQLGQLIKAQETFRKVAAEKLGPDSPEVFGSVVEEARKALHDLKPRIPYVSVVVQGAGPHPVTVTMDGVKVPEALVGVPRPVDPGTHRFEAATQTGGKSGVKTLTVDEGGTETVVLTVREQPEAQPAAAAEPPATVQPEPVPAEAAPESEVPPPGPHDEGTGMKIGSYVAFGAGAVGLAVGVGFAIDASNKRSEADDLCNLPQGACPADQQQRVDDLDSKADSSSTLSTVGFFIGGVGIATGVTLLLLDSSGSSEDTTEAGVYPWVGWRSAGLSGRF